jgi:holliday junction DNA helicase RuvA
MIGSLRGRLVDRWTKGEVLVEVNGVGYRVTIAPGTVGKLGALDGEVFLHIHTHVREDALILYGFPTRDERACFEVLISAHGVGPALAMSVLSSHTPDSLRHAVATDDVDALTIVPGVGKKTAARLLIELKSKLIGADFGDYDAAIAAASEASGTRNEERKAPDPRNDVRAALNELGYGADEIRNTLRKLPPDGDSAALLKQALGILASGG